jgi:hypothetical protein
MLYKATDCQFADAATDPSKRDALLHWLKRERKVLLIAEVITVAVMLALCAWGIAISNQVVADILHSSVLAVPQRGWGHDLDTVKIIIVVICFLIFFLAWTHLVISQTDTRVKFLVYAEAREKQGN